MYLGSNKQNQIRYHGRDALDNRTINQIYTPLGAISPNGQIMPDFKVNKTANAPSSANTSSTDWANIVSNVTNGLKVVGGNLIDYKIQMLNFKRQQAYLAQQQQISDAQSFQSFAKQNPVATQGAKYSNPPDYITSGGGFDFAKYAPYLAGGVALVVLAMVMKRG